MLPDMDDVAVDFVCGAAARHQFHQGVPAFGDRLPGTGGGVPEAAPFGFEFFDGAKNLDLLGSPLFDILGGAAGEGGAFRRQCCRQGVRDVDFALQYILEAAGGIRLHGLLQPALELQ